MAKRHELEWFAETMDRDSRFIEHRFDVVRSKQATFAMNELNLDGQNRSRSQLPMTTFSFSVSANDSLPIDLTLDDFLANDARYGPLSVELDAARGEAEIDVWITASFLNGPAYDTPNSDGHFYFDCESLGGRLGCEILKWGRLTG